MDTAISADADIEERKALLGFTREHENALHAQHDTVGGFVDELIDQFFCAQMDIPAIRHIIEHNESLMNLKRATRAYVMSFFGGTYGPSYVTTRQRIGRIHAAVGVPVKLYAASLHKLELLLADRLMACGVPGPALAGLHKLFMLDLQFALDTFVGGMVQRAQTNTPDTQMLEKLLETTVAERTAEITRMARTDHLTGLWNRRAFGEKLEECLDRAEQGGEVLSLVFVDLDAFKKVNDAHGHQAGDQILELIGEGLRATPELSNNAFRYGGDEFCLLMPGKTTREAADGVHAVAAQVCETIRAQMGYGIGYSIGIATAGPDSYPAPRALLAAADLAMYARKGLKNQPLRG